MVELRPLAVGDAEALFAFELENRIWFEHWVGPRPPTYWEVRSLREIIAAQVADADAMFLIWQGEEIVGRVNLTAFDAGVAQLGYRVGERHTGRGMASRAVALALGEATTLGLWEVEARVRDGNAASRRVLERTGFRVTGRDGQGDDVVTLYRKFLG
ncbi:GNAT family N-acetyltransferase [Aliiroseovarius subalbicans]|uniref:GNAT family N-acetyltransferase n=1 Tax=Aliiroseovarius subalbicans TaxID=2925840 RepID=UPI001F59E62D|nr:GNAT family N-acetyltransferase [uncultured Aliiroseovarius sp.]MCI2399383.1 GNAT family N-acetyltransferase [Aliiroseovarius subalbicans]